MLQHMAAIYSNHTCTQNSATGRLSSGEQKRTRQHTLYLHTPVLKTLPIHM